MRAGAFALLSTVPYFPKGTIHIAVVDPGVGTEGMGLVLESGGQTFVGPDNGLLIPAARSLGTPLAYRIATPFASSSTFHGRDVFAPAAALLAAGQSPASIGPGVPPRNLCFGEAKKTDRGIEATIIYVDRFGNLILNMQKLPGFRTKSGLIPASSEAGYSPYLPISILTNGDHTYILR